MRVLVIAAHPDDEVLGCGGMMARHAAQGDEVHTIILGDGITARYNADQLGLPEVQEQLKKIEQDAHRVGEILGVKSTKVFGLHCCRFDLVPLIEITKIIEREIKNIKPDIIYTHGPYDSNRDHERIFQAVTIATRPMGKDSVKKVYLFEVLSSTEWNFREVFRPQVYANISSHIEKKVEGMALYESEARPFPHPRSSGAIRALAQKRGCEVGFEYAEAFEVFRELQ